LRKRIGGSRGGTSGSGSRIQARQGFVTQQEQSFGVGIQPAQGIDVPGEAERGQRAMGRPVGRKAGHDAARFVESDEHGDRVGQGRANSEV
jgi:hypothetical protein